MAEGDIRMWFETDEEVASFQRWWAAVGRASFIAWRDLEGMGPEDRDTIPDLNLAALFHEEDTQTDYDPVKTHIFKTWEGK